MHSHIHMGNLGYLKFMIKYILPILLVLTALNIGAQVAQFQVKLHDKKQIIDGFGAHQGNDDSNKKWWLDLYYDDLGASIYRVDLTPIIKTPYSDLNYYSPWFMGSATRSVFNLEDPANPNGPENNRVRTYTGPEDYSRSFGNRNAPIAIMGPNIEQNILYFNFPNDEAIRTGIAKSAQLGGFKLIGSLWSPVPWVKVSSGNAWNQNWWPGPVIGAKWPFIWGGNFAGGKVDVSGRPLSVFNDVSVGGNGPTSSLVQFARSTAAYILGYQRSYQTKFYAISIQNELNFEQYYNSAFYPLSSQYITAVKVIRAEFDKHPELAGIKIMGPEDLLGGDSYGMWEYGSSQGPIHKNLQYLKNIVDDPSALAAVDFFCIHGYDNSGVSSSGADPALWNWWANGWQTNPAPGLPSNVRGFTSYNKKSWMTETSGEKMDWLFPASGFPNNGAWSLALKIHQAFTVGMQSAWLYWTFTESAEMNQVSDFALTNMSSGSLSPKYVATKHFFKFIRPGSYRLDATLTGNASVQGSSYFHDSTEAITIVLINSSAQSQSTKISIPDLNTKAPVFDKYTSSGNQFWNQSTLDIANENVVIPAYGLVTLTANLKRTTASSDLISSGNNLAIYPNPIVQNAEIQFYVDEGGLVELTIYSLDGRRVYHWTDDYVAPGDCRVQIETSTWITGSYFCYLKLRKDTACQMIFVGN